MMDQNLNRAIPSLINGVSQQPPTLRLTSQAEAQLNALSSINDGVRKRPPLEHVAKVIASGAIASSGYKIQIIDRDATERYIVLIGDQSIQVFDFEGTAKTVNTPDGVAYLNVADVKTEFAATSIADYTFITNRTISPAMAVATTPARPNEFVFHCKQTTTLTKFYLTIDTVTGGPKTVVGLPVTGAYTSEVPISMKTALDADVDISPNWVFTVRGNALHGVQTGSTGSPEEVTCTDNYGDQYHSLAYNSIQSFSSLPARGFDGFKVEVIGDANSTFDNYWVTYDEEGEYWKETLDGGITYQFDASTMPHVLVKLPSGEFDFKEATWSDREKGDEDSAPEPNFVGVPIRDLVVQDNRLSFVADEYTVLSETSSFFNFWPTTVTALLDSDPINTAGHTNRVAIWDWMVPFNQVLMLFSGQGGVQSQYGVADDVLTPETLPPKAKSFYKSSTKVRPVSIGTLLYFVVDRDSASGLMEYRLDNTGKASASDTTAHVPSYLPGNVSQLTNSEVEKTIALFSEDEENSLYIYRYYFADDEKIQASWSTWTFGASDVIHAVEFIDAKMWTLIERTDGLHLGVLDLRKLQDGDLVDGNGLPIRCHFDSLVELQGSYDVPTDITTWTLPYAAEAGYDYQVVLNGNFGSSGGRIVSDAVFTATSTTVTAVGDWTEDKVLIGSKFNTSYEVSEIVLDEGNSAYKSSSAPITQGRLQINRMAVLFKDTGSFNVSVAFKEETTSYEYPYTGRFVGRIVLGPPTLRDGRHEFDVGGRSTDVIITLSNDSYLPSTFTGLEWEGRYFARAQRA